MSDANQPDTNPPPGGRHLPSRSAPAPGTGSKPDSGPDSDSPDAAALQTDIEETRERLADTVEQLQAKLDVKARASAGAHDTVEMAKEKVLDSDGKPRPAALGAGGAVLVGVIAVVAVKWWRRRQARKHPWERRR